MLQLWRITMRHLAFVPSERYVHSVEVAVSSRSERNAVDFAKANIHSPSWWDNYIITEVTPIGELWAAEGLVVPVEDLD